MSERTDRAASASQRPLEPASGTEEELIHEQAETFLVGKSGSRTLHLSNEEDETLCTRYRHRDLEPVDSATYPVGYKPICRHCVAAWRDSSPVGGEKR